MEKLDHSTQRTLANATVSAMMPVWKSKLTDCGVVIEVLEFGCRLRPANKPVLKVSVVFASWSISER